MVTCGCFLLMVRSLSLCLEENTLTSWLVQGSPLRYPPLRSLRQRGPLFLPLFYNDGAQRPGQLLCVGITTSALEPMWLLWEGMCLPGPLWHSSLRGNGAAKLYLPSATTASEVCILSGKARSLTGTLTHPLQVLSSLPHCSVDLIFPSSPD